MRKSPKAEKVQALLAKGMTTKKIIDKLKVSPSYVWLVKKKMGEAEATQDAIKELAHKITSGRQSQKANSVSDPTNVNGILNERGSRYGNFLDHAAITQGIKGLIAGYLEDNNKVLAHDQQEALDMIAHKIGRIINGDPDYVDSWVDIAGYAQLVADRLQGKVR